MPEKRDSSSTPTDAPRLSAAWWPWLLGGWAFLVLLWLVPHVQTAGLNLSPAARLTLETQIRDTWAKILWSAVTLIGAALVWRYLASLATVVEQSAKTLAAAERNAYFASQSAATDRYGRAMALLGDERTEVRLGGVYSLERLARESDKDHGAIIEVLAAYIRSHAAWHEGEPVAPRTRADIQAILTVLGRRHSGYDVPDFHLDLHGVSLVRAYLPHANFERAFLYETNLEGALLQGANLKGSWLWKANFKDASLEGARLEGADLTGAAGLTREQLASAVVDSTTKLPDHLRGFREVAGQTAEEGPDPEDLKLPTRT